jgi:phosphate-transporting ATPase
LLRIEGLISPRLHIPWLEVSEGECLAIMGASGAGKSLFLRSIVDLDPNQGEVSLSGRSRARMSACEWRRQVMLVPAESGWWADTVGVHFLAGHPAEALVASLGLPPEALGWSVARLSSGERHRLAIARALSFEPQAILLDEPAAALDLAATDRLEAVLKGRLAAGACLLLVTHDKEQAARMATRTIVIADGRVVRTSGSDA